MTTKLVESGITFEALRALYKHFGVPGIVGYLSMKSSDLKKVRVTKTIAALAKIICCLQKLPEFKFEEYQGKIENIFEKCNTINCNFQSVFWQLGN